MRISDWSSDVCSSDLDHPAPERARDMVNRVTAASSDLLRNRAGESKVKIERMTRWPRSILKRCASASARWISNAALPNRSRSGARMSRSPAHKIGKAAGREKGGTDGEKSGVDV